MAKLASNDKRILSLKKVIEDKKKLLKSSEKFSPITNCNITIGDKRYNLNVLNKQEILLLIGSLQAFNKGVIEILPEATLEISGYSIKDWLTDLVSKYNTLDRKIEQERLKALEDKLHNMLSSDTKVSLDLDDLAGQI